MSNGYYATTSNMIPRSVGKSYGTHVTSLPKEKKMSWFKRKVKNWLDSSEEYPLEKASYASVSRDTISANGMNITVHRAAGGFVIESRQYDVTRDSNNNRLFIVTDEHDLGQELGKIITMECLRR